VGKVIRLDEKKRPEKLFIHHCEIKKIDTLKSVRIFHFDGTEWVFNVPMEHVQLDLEKKENNLYIASNASKDKKFHQLDMAAGTVTKFTEEATIPWEINQHKLYQAHP